MKVGAVQASLCITAQADGDDCGYEQSAKLRACGLIQLLIWCSADTLQGKVAKWWVPDDCVLVKEIPHTATGKISKLELRKLFKDYKPERARL